MTQEITRCEAALQRAIDGDVVSLVSSGDPGVYGMAGLAIELAFSKKVEIPLEIVPGITSANAAAAKFGAPLMLDFAVISLSDLLVPWDVIKSRLEGIASIDIAAALYNPRSKKRVMHLEEAQRIFSKYRSPVTPVGIGTALGTDEEHIVLTDLEHFLSEEITMRSIVLIGNSSSKFLGRYFVTPRGYEL